LGARLRELLVRGGVIEVLMLEPESSPAAAPLGIALTAQTMLFALLGGVQSLPKAPPSAPRH
jgi:hypothetical protein